MPKKSFFIIEKIKKYRKCPALLPSESELGREWIGYGAWDTVERHFHGTFFILQERFAWLCLSSCIRVSKEEAMWICVHTTHTYTNTHTHRTVNPAASFSSKPPVPWFSHVCHNLTSHCFIRELAQASTLCGAYSCKGVYNAAYTTSYCGKAWA